ncbi:tyrosine-type recombinase/integrase [Pseudonocardia acidicola]|uniref:Tyrosine-type recombinase/integrase n=1 Tax=Pseudonocardia acidicola TaxID=2724939 RepID=A0ABX1SBP5_9PSEU|nr:tyrosine-type recombinase/integrase [Pseudonocardia acidicola]NMH98990.1 tyrosine-type recombinase/integrase [Pseudonocardia acidicola]
MTATYDVRVWSIATYQGQRGTAYIVRWKVGDRARKERFKTRALADSFRSELISATRRGEAFSVETGHPISASRPSRDLGWYEFACDYVDMKWAPAAATYRRSISEALTAITVGLLDGDRGRPDAALIRRSLHRWAFNTSRRDTADCPAEVREALGWVRRHSGTVARLAEPAVLRRVLTEISTKLDGTPGAASVVSKRRRVLSNIAEYAVERGCLDVNPLPAFKWKAPKAASGIDRRSVVNPVQARTLLNAVRETKRSGPRLVAFFGLMYFSGMRPEEAANVRKHNLSIPDSGWGEIHLEEATPYAGPDWTNDGRQRDRRQLKNRARGESRVVPCPPELTEMLQQHIAEFGTGADGRLFVGERSTDLPKLTYMRAWRAARRQAFTPETAATPLGATPYTLRHACVSTWLNGGVPATQVAEWAGHSVEVLLKVYAKCLDGQDTTARRRVMQALGHRDDG